MRAVKLRTVTFSKSHFEVDEYSKAEFSGTLMLSIYFKLT